MTTKIGLKWVAFGEPDFTGFPHFDIGGSDRISVWFHWLYMGYTGFYLVLLMFFFLSTLYIECRQKQEKSRIFTKHGLVDYKSSRVVEILPFCFKNK